jgi:hypothetical protein
MGKELYFRRNKEVYSLLSKLLQIQPFMYTPAFLISLRPEVYDLVNFWERRINPHVAGSGQKGCNPAGESPAVTIVRFGHAAVTLI